MKKIPLAILVLLVIPIYSFAFDYVIDDFTNYAIPTMAKPVKGVPFNDPLFNVEIVRITDVQAMFGSGDHYIKLGYSKHDSENADGTYLLFETAPNSVCPSGWIILNALPTSVSFKGQTVPGYGLLQVVPQADVGQAVSIYPRWSTSDPDVFYYERWGQLRKYSVSANTSTLVHQFRYIAGTATGGSSTKLIDTTKKLCGS